MGTKERMEREQVSDEGLWLPVEGVLEAATPSPAGLQPFPGALPLSSSPPLLLAPIAGACD